MRGFGGKSFSYRQVINWLAVLLVVITPVSVQQWLRIGYSLDFVKFFLFFIFLFFMLFYIFNYYDKEKLRDVDRKIIHIYLAWIVICIVRGCFEASDYWQWKNLVSASFALLLPLFCFIFSDPMASHRSLRVWFPWASLIFIFMFPFLTQDGIVFYVEPFLLLGCLLPLVPREWRWGAIFLFLMMIFIDFEARSQIIKAIVPILLSLLYYFRGVIPYAVVKFGHALLSVLPVLFLVMGVAGNQDIFSVFEMASSSAASSQADMSSRENIEGFAANTRTFMYKEVISSAVDNNYVIWGRTPARGNDSAYFGDAIAWQLRVDRYERPLNEVGFLNVFTWTGLIGLFLYCLIFLRAAWLGVYRSASIPMKIIGLYAAFHFFFGFVEDCNRFDTQNITMWMGLAMCLSEDFRSMSDKEFKAWFKSLFVIIRPQNSKWGHSVISSGETFSD